jgi:hypothetical protein
LSGLIDENEYMAFGVSKPQGQSQMIGADVAVAFIDGYLGIVDDYNITAKAPCGGVLGLNKGVCKDEVTGKTRKSFNYFNQIKSSCNNNQMTRLGKLYVI